MKRFLQLVSGVNRIHHYTYSYGWKMPFVKYAYFPWYNKRWNEKKVFRKLYLDNNGEKKYHNCTLTGVY